MKNNLQNRILYRVAYYYSPNACEIITFGADKTTDYIFIRIMAARIFRKKYPDNAISMRQMRVL